VNPDPKLLAVTSADQVGEDQQGDST